MEEGDAERRMEFCLQMQEIYEENQNFIKNIMFSDEATFSTNGIVSSQNIRWWNNENPKWVIQSKRQYSQKVNVWCGLLRERIIGPFFFNENLNGERFLEFLNTELWEEIHNLPITYRQELYFQLDGAPIHNTAGVREWLHDTFPEKWIGRSSPNFPWPPRSPDLTPLDFYFWGAIKNIVYRNRPRNREELRQRIQMACREVPARQVRKAISHTKKVWEKCIELNGGLVEAASF